MASVDGSTETVAANAEHHLWESVWFLEDLEQRQDLPEGFDKLTVKLVLELTEGSAKYIRALSQKMAEREKAARGS